MPIPHLSVPFAIDARGHARTVEQDTAAEIVQNVAVVLSTRPGQRQALPAFGIEDRTFDVLDDVDWLVDAVTAWEPRADVDVTVTAVRQTGRFDITVEVDRQ